MGVGGVQVSVQNIAFAGDGPRMEASYRSLRLIAVNDLTSNESRASTKVRPNPPCQSFPLQLWGNKLSCSYDLAKADDASQIH